MIAISAPRVALVILWLVQRWRFESVFDGILIPLLGVIFLPFTTLVYLFLAPGGIVDYEWIIIALAVFADLASYSSGAYSGRKRLKK